MRGGRRGGRVVKLSHLPAAAARRNLAELCREMGAVVEVQVAAHSIFLSSLPPDHGLTSACRWCTVGSVAAPSPLPTPSSPSPPRRRLCGGGQGEGRDPAGVGRHLKLCLNPSLTKIAQQYLSSIALHCLAMFKLVLFENYELRTTN